MILIIDNYDSFTYNLVACLNALGEATTVRRNDAIDAAAVIAMQPTAVLLSPGPCGPDQAGVCLDLLESAPPGLPILGVCLGHQAIGQAFGGRIVRAKALMHGKTSRIRHDGAGVFAGIEDGFEATRYHSLAVSAIDLPACLAVSATSADGEIMGLFHRERPIHGVQFHPESFATQHGSALLANFLSLAKRENGYLAN